MAEHKEWLVDLIVTSQHRYTVLARTAEEAVANAEALLADGERGLETGVQVESADAVTGDVYADVEFEEEVIEFGS